MANTHLPGLGFEDSLDEHSLACFTYHHLIGPVPFFVHKVSELESPHLVEAVFLWTGWGRDVTPRRDDSLLVDRFGADTAAALLCVIKSLQDEFYSSNARYIAADLREMERVVVEDFRKIHPEVADDILQAFSWCYTFDFK